MLAEYYSPQRGYGLYWKANEESLQTKKILCKEKEAKKAKKNIGNKSLFCTYFEEKLPYYEISFQFEIF